MLHEQLPLNIHLRDDAAFESFYPGPNQAVFNALWQFAHLQGEHFIYLWGCHGVGKTHLLQAVCHYVQDHYQTGFYLPFKEVDAYDVSVLEGLENFDLICLDDIHLIAGQSIWEEALFHLYNRLRDNQRYLLVSASAAAPYLGIKLPDLVSRLVWGLTFHLHELSDQEKLAALQFRAQLRGIKLNDSVGQFLLNRYARDMHGLFVMLDKLDQASLIAQRRLTIPFVKNVLGV